MAKTLTVGDLVKRLGSIAPELEVWVEDRSNPEGFSPAVGISFGRDSAPAKGEPSVFVVIHIKR
jgi:hypothetical protein